MVDPIGFGAGFGAGQGAGRQDADAANVRAKKAAEDAELAQAGSLMMAGKLGQERRVNAELKEQLEQRWIPYARHLKASIFGRNVERQMLQDALRRADPAHAEALIAQADQAKKDEYHQNYHDQAKRDEVTAAIVKESQE